MGSCLGRVSHGAGGGYGLTPQPPLLHTKRGGVRRSVSLPCTCRRPIAQLKLAQDPWSNTPRRYLQSVTDPQPIEEILSTVSLPPLENLNRALGANHDLATGLDELIDNAIDAGADTIAIIFHSGDVLLEGISIHDNGSGMTLEKMETVLRLGGHQANSERNIGRYGMGLKEGSFANGAVTHILSKTAEGSPAGLRLSKESFEAGILSPSAFEERWAWREQIKLTVEHGTTVMWSELFNVYRGDSAKEAGEFLTRELERVRKHVGIRYHRFLSDGRVSIQFFTAYEGFVPTKAPAPTPTNPLGYRRSGQPSYPRLLTFMGVPDAPGVTAHIWPHRSQSDEFKLDSASTNGHQGFYVYDADRLITMGGWGRFRSDDKSLQLLRIEISDPRVIEEYVTISPQKGSVNFKEGFHDFMRELRDPDDSKVGLERVYADAVQVVKKANQRSGKAKQLAEAGKGIAPSIKRVIEREASLRSGEPINVVWFKVQGDNFVAIDPRKRTIYINERYRPFLNEGKSSLNDAPLVKTLLYLLFNDHVSAGRSTRESQATVEMLTEVINAAAREMVTRLEGDPVFEL